MSCDLSIIIPAHNEAGRLPATFDAVAGYFERECRDYEVVVVDDASGDGTAGLVKARASAWQQLRLVSLPDNLGKGGAVRNGMAQATGARRLFMDADLSTPMECLQVLESALGAGADIAIGSRAHPDARIVRRQAAPRRRMGQIFNLAVRVLTGLRWRDTQCGFKLFTAEAVGRILPLAGINGFAFDVEWLLIAREAGLQVAECPVTWRNDPCSRVSMVRHPCMMLAELLAIRARWQAGAYRDSQKPSATSADSA